MFGQFNRGRTEEFDDNKIEYQFDTEHPKTPLIDLNKGEEIVTLNIRGSRRKRTIGSAPRPETAPSNRKAETGYSSNAFDRPLTNDKTPASATDFDFFLKDRETNSGLFTISESHKKDSSHHPPSNIEGEPSFTFPDADELLMNKSNYSKQLSLEPPQLEPGPKIARPISFQEPRFLNVPESHNFLFPEPKGIGIGLELELERAKEEEIEKNKKIAMEFQSPRTAKLKKLEEEKREAEEEAKKSLDDLYNKMETELKQDLQNLEQDYNFRLKEAKDEFGSKKSVLEDFQKHQEKLRELENIITKSSQTVSILSSKYGKEKEYLEDIKKQQLTLKERALETRESRLLNSASLLEQEKKRLDSKQKGLEELENRLYHNINEKKKSLLEDHARMYELQEAFKQQDKEKKMVLSLEQHRLKLLEEQLLREERTLEEEVITKEKEIQDYESRMETEKDEGFAQVQYEKNSLSAKIAHVEKFRRSIPSINAENNKRLAIYEEKVKKVKIEEENLRLAQEMLERDKALFEKEAQKIHSITSEIEKESELLIEQKEEIERKFRELEYKKQEIQTINSKSRFDKQRVDLLKASLSKRKQAYEALKAPMNNIEIPRVEVVEIEEPVRYVPRPKSAVRPRPGFKAADFLKDLESYQAERQEIHSYIISEGTHLLNSKLDFETGVNNVFKASSYCFSTPSSSFIGKISSMRLNSGNAKIGESYTESSLYKDN